MPVQPCGVYPPSQSPTSFDVFAELVLDSIIQVGLGVRRQVLDSSQYVRYCQSWESIAYLES